MTQHTITFHYMFTTLHHRGPKTWAIIAKTGLKPNMSAVAWVPVEFKMASVDAIIFILNFQRFFCMRGLNFFLTWLMCLHC